MIGPGHSFMMSKVPETVRLQRIDLSECSLLGSWVLRVWSWQPQRSCFGGWRQAEQINAGLLLLVAIIVFIVKVSAFTIDHTGAHVSSWCPHTRLRCLFSQHLGSRPVYERSVDRRTMTTLWITASIGCSLSTNNQSGLLSHRSSHHLVMETLQLVPSYPSNHRPRLPRTRRR